MKRRANKKDEPNDKELFFETLDKIFLKFFIYLFLTLIVLAIGKFFWSVGIVLFIILALFMASESLINGFAFALGTVISIFSITIDSYLKLKNKASELEPDFYSFGLAGISLSGLFSLSLLGLTYALYIFFFPKSFD